jgi:hypothetical protein
MTDLFQSQEPVLADWYSGQLEFGIGKFTYNDWWGYYDNYVWLNVENGKVIEKKITRRFYQETELNFGKYKGKKFEEILHGKIQRNTYTTIKDFITSLLEFIRDKEYGFKVQCPYFKVTELDVELVREIRKYGIEYFLTQNFIATSSKVFWENSNEDERASKLSILLEKILTSDFTKPSTLSKHDLHTAEIAEKTVLLNGDLQYLNWALKTIEFFTIPPNQLDKEFSIKILKSLKINRLNDFVFEYEPIIETIKYKFLDNIIMVNREKFEKINKVKYDSEYELYTLDVTDKELNNEFGYFLDENHTSQQYVDFESHHHDHIDSYSGRGSYGQYAGFYAQDVEDLSDDFINDVLDGDPDAYWNID